VSHPRLDLASMLMCVDTLFATASSEERKYWGFLLFQRVIHDAPVEFIPGLFTQNLVRCLMNQLSSPKRFLHRAAGKTTKSIIGRAASEPESRIPILKALLTAPYGDINFDRITKTKTVETLLSHSNHSDFKQLTAFFGELLLRPGSQDEKDAVSRRLVAADQIVSTVRNMHLESTDSGRHPSGTFLIKGILDLFSKCAYFDLETLPNTNPGRPSPPISQSTRNIFRTRISSCIAYLVAKAIDSADFSCNLIRTIQDGDEHAGFGTPLLEADDTVRQVITRAWEILDEAESRSKAESSKSSKANYYRSVKLLYSLTILQVYNEDLDAVGMLGELNDCFEGLLHKKSTGKGSATLVEILLSFASRPSQLFRRLAQQVFTACAPDVDETGLQSMVKVADPSFR